MNYQPLQLLLPLSAVEHGDLGAGEGKVCSKCAEYLPLSAFSMTSGGNYLRPECRKCNRYLHHVRQVLRRQYGMPKKDYICPICNQDEEQVKGKGNTKNGSWVLDHCHETETFRGWLCHKCNRALGGFDDDSAILRRAVDYLSNTSENNKC
jgi:hypothetical protein